MSADAEAAGAGPTADETTQALRTEGAAAPNRRMNAAEPELAPDGDADRLNQTKSFSVATVLAVVAALLFAFILYTALV
ncbi:MAG: hypothetical protein ACK4YQ_09795 [Phenylobacterium sp.]|uniref:hypothetical protein n=1 Tax=Phenylobacterium sp. TaxID=1871053 RepID=UPI003918BA21